MKIKNIYKKYLRVLTSATYLFMLLLASFHFHNTDITFWTDNTITQEVNHTSISDEDCPLLQIANNNYCYNAFINSIIIIISSFPFNIKNKKLFLAENSFDTSPRGPPQF